MDNNLKFEKIFKEFYTPLLRFAIRYVNSKSIAEDIVQETMSDLWEGGTYLKIHTSTKSYLFRITHNKCIDYIKKEILKSNYKNYSEYFNNSYIRAENHYDSSLIQTSISKAINKLPKECKNVFLLSRVEGLKYKEIAEKLDVSIKNIEGHISKALKILRLELKDYMFIILITYINK